MEHQEFYQMSNYLPLAKLPNHHQEALLKENT